jgi:hypothetical protein
MRTVADGSKSGNRVAMVFSDDTGPMTMTEQALRSANFVGFVPFADLRAALVSTAAGVYVVLRPSTSPPSYLPSSPAGHFKGKDPTVSEHTLSSAWVPGAQVLYIGKAGAVATTQRGLRKRLDEYRAFGDGQPVGHRGGRYIWQLADSSELLVAWLPTPDEEPFDVEHALIQTFRADHAGARPFANLTNGRRPISD